MFENTQSGFASEAEALAFASSEETNGATKERVEAEIAAREAAAVAPVKAWGQNPHPEASRFEDEDRGRNW
jgi:hypothetical protein